MSLRFKISSVAIIAALALAPVASFAKVPKGNPAHGKELYVECAGCHDLKENRVGPRHCGVVGRPAASVPDYYAYSEAMKESEIVWDKEHLFEFLQSPFTYVSGTMMGYVGLNDEQDRADLIAYLEKAGNDPAVCGAAN